MIERELPPSSAAVAAADAEPLRPDGQLAAPPVVQNSHGRPANGSFRMRTYTAPHARTLEGDEPLLVRLRVGGQTTAHL